MVWRIIRNLIMLVMINVAILAMPDNIGPQGNNVESAIVAYAIIALSVANASMVVKLIHSIYEFDKHHSCFSVGDVLMHPIVWDLIGVVCAFVIIAGVLHIGEYFGWTNLTMYIAFSVGIAFVITLLIKIDRWWENRRSRRGSSSDHS